MTCPSYVRGGSARCPERAPKADPGGRESFPPDRRRRKKQEIQKTDKTKKIQKKSRLEIKNRETGQLLADDVFWGVKGVAVLWPEVVVFGEVPGIFRCGILMGKFAPEEEMDFFFGENRRAELMERGRGRCCRTCDHDSTLAFVGKFPFSSPAGGLPGVRIPAAMLPAFVVVGETVRLLRPAPGRAGERFPERFRP